MSGLKIVDCSFPILISTVSNHLLIKDKILNSIELMGRHYVEDNFQIINNTDWHLHQDVARPYFEYVAPSINEHNHLISEIFNSGSLEVTKIWFQQYDVGNFHKWHIHNSCMFSNIYYVDLNGSSPKTSFRSMGKEFNVPVESGMIITFPSFLQHCSKPNECNYIKTVIAFNSDYYMVKD